MDIVIDQIECALSDELAQFCQIICRHIGFKVPENEWAALAQILHERVNALQMGSTQSYLGFLESTEQDNDNEWNILANRLRVGESYFFRDSGQMTLLETVILPELLQRNKHKHGLRILSAGCSTGEEAYSIAMLLDRIIPIWDIWDIKIIGVDIDAEALETAQRGIYTEWSLRRVPQEIRSLYFEQQGANWHICPRIIAKVEFSCVNLVKHNLPAEHIQLNDMDLILCRNVFIYFREDTIATLVDKFVRTLTAGGYLMTGHGELYGIKHPMLEVRLFATSVVYQKLLVAKPIPHPTVETNPAARKVLRAVNKEVKPPLRAITADELQAMLQQKRYNQVIALGTKLLEKSPRELKIWRLLAQAHISLGQYTQAESCCTRLLNIDEFYAPAYFIMARIAHEQGELPQRIELLKKALYLDQDFVAAMLELAEIYDHSSNVERAKKMRETAHRLLSTLPENGTVDMLNEWKVGDLLTQVRRLL